MPQVVELPPIGQDQRGALAALVRVCKETPGKGEAFREFRSRLRAAKLWDRERPQTVLRFLGVSGAQVMPSIFMQTVAAAANEDDTQLAVLDRVWHLNSLLGKAVLDLCAQRAYGKDEIYKHLASAAYRGIVPSRPGLETWLQIAHLVRPAQADRHRGRARGARRSLRAARRGRRRRRVPRRGQARAGAGYPGGRRRRGPASRRRRGRAGVVNPGGRRGPHGLAVASAAPASVGRERAVATRARSRGASVALRRGVLG